MFRRDAFVLLAVALVGIVFTIYMVIGSTPFFPKHLQTEQGECPPNSAYRYTHEGAVMDEFTANWYSGELVAFDERPLFQDKDRERQLVRFTLLRDSQDRRGNLMVRTVETEGGLIRLIGKRMPGIDGCYRATQGCSVDRILTEAEQLRLATAQAHLFQKASYGCPNGIHGPLWIMEASGLGQYRFWSDWAPVRGDLRELALVMLHLTGWQV